MSSSQGFDGIGNTYENASDLWDRQLDASWYNRGAEYWSQVEPTDDGVLGGYGNLNVLDIEFSEEFLDDHVLPRLTSSPTAVADCGAGIGRISRDLLVRKFDQIDVIEQDQKFVDKARESLGDRIRSYMTIGLQDFDPEPETYDVIWIQWVIGHLPDEECVSFFERCARGLRKNGCIILKENVSSSGFVFDENDTSITRSYEYFHELFEKSKMKVIVEKKQNNWPKELFAIWMFALAPENK